MNAIILLIILIALNAMFAATEIAVISMNDVKLKNMAEGGDKRAIRLVNLTEQPCQISFNHTGSYYSCQLASECCCR